MSQSKKFMLAFLIGALASALLTLVLAGAAQS